MFDPKPILKSLVDRVERVFNTEMKKLSDAEYVLSLKDDEIALYIENGFVFMEIIEVGDDDLIIDKFGIYPSDNRYRKEREFEHLMKITKRVATL
jgi:hypothetical protein